MNAGGLDVMGKGPASLVRGDLAHEGAFSAEARKAGDGVGSRAARHDCRRAHGIVQRLRLLLVNELHRALAQPGLDEKLLVDRSDDVDDRIAEAENVKSMIGHGILSIPAASAS